MEGLLQHLVVLVFHHEGSQLTVEFTEDRHVTVTHLIEHTDHRPLTVGGIVCGLERTDIGDIAVVTYRIVVDVVSHLLYQTVITHCDVSQCGIIDARVLHEALADFHHLVKGSQTDVTIEDDAMEVIRLELLVNQYSLPVLCPADILL